MSTNKNSKNNKTPRRKKYISRTGYIAAIAFLIGTIGATSFSLATRGGNYVGYINDGSDETKPDYTTEEYYDDEYEEEPTDEYVPIVEETTYDDEDMYYNQEDYFDIVNESVYEKLKAAKKNFDKLYENGEVSSQLSDHNLDESEYNYIDDGMRHVYNDICSYIDNYEMGYYDECYKEGSCLSDDYITVMSPQYLYSFLVVPELGEEYQADFYEYDSDGNIVLNNYNKIHLIGDDDTLIRISEGDDVETRFDYYVKLPKIILDHYLVINDVNGDDDICYIMNVSNTERLCRKDIADIKSGISEAYGLSNDDIAITWNDEAESWAYRDNNTDEELALLDYDANNRFETYWEIVGAIGAGEANVYELDAAIDSLQAKHGKIR